MKNLVKNILVVRQHNQIGDMLCSLPLYAALKKKYPSAEITLVAAKTNYIIPFREINPYINHVLVVDKSSLKKILIFIIKLRSRKYDIGIVPSTIALSRTSHIINRISGAKTRIGVKSINRAENSSHKLLNVKKDFLWNGVHQKFRNLEIANLAGCDLPKDELTSIKFSFDEGERAFAESIRQKHFPDVSKKIIAFHAGAGKAQNTWDTENFIKLIQKLYNVSAIYILITSGWTDELIVKKVTAALKEDNIKFFVLHNSKIKELAALLNKVHLYITNDTGSMHIAAFADAKMISLFGPTDPKEWAPDNKHQVFIKSSTGNINDISVEEVYDEVQKMLTG